MSARFPRWCLVAIAAFALSGPARAADPEDFDALQKKLLQLMLQGNPKPDDLMKMVAEMNKLLLKDFPDLPPLELPPNFDRLLPQLPAQPGLRPQMRLALPFPQPLGERPGQPVADPLAGDQKLKEFDEAIEKLKDDPAAQAELKKARDEYKKALEEGLKKNGGGVARPERPAMPDLPIRPRVVPALPDLDFARPLDRPAARAGGPARLGVVIEKPSALLAEHLNLPDEIGVVLVEVQPGSPAAKAGLRPNDVVVKLGGKDAPSELARFQQLVAGLKASEKVEAVVFRKGKKETVVGIDLTPAR